MTQLHLAPTQTALWVNLVQDASQKASVDLNESQESYIVYMLMRFVNRRRLLDTTIAIPYLESTLETRRMRRMVLPEIADSTLLLAGLFPKRSRKLNVTSSYFTDMSRLCFTDLANVCEKLQHNGEAQLYREIGDNVDQIACVLSHAREVSLPDPTSIRR